MNNRELEKYLRHLPECNINNEQGWLEADQALAATPGHLRDSQWQYAVDEAQRKRKVCTCGLDSLLATLPPSSESPSAEQVAVEFAEWIFQNKISSRKVKDDEILWLYYPENFGYGSEKTTSELFSIFQQSKQNRK